MANQPIGEPEVSSVHMVKTLLCYILDRLSGVCRRITDEQLQLISEDSGIINYFFFSDALDELIANGSVTSESASDGKRIISLAEKGRLGAEYFNSTIPLVFRKKLLYAAFSFFSRLERKNQCSCEIRKIENGCMVDFVMEDKDFELMNMSFYAPDEEQAELIRDNIMANPQGAYSNILQLLLNNREEKIDVEKYL